MKKKKINPHFQYILVTDYTGDSNVGFDNIQIKCDKTVNSHTIQEITRAQNMLHQAKQLKEIAGIREIQIGFSSHFTLESASPAWCSFPKQPEYVQRDREK